MSEKKFHLEIVTPTELKFEGDVTLVRLPSVQGEIGVLAGHAPILALLDPGVSLYRCLERDYPLATGEGFVTVAEDRVVVLVASAEGPQEIEAGSARAQLEALEREATGPAEELRPRRLLARARHKVSAWE